MPTPKRPHHLKVVAGTARPDREGPPLVQLPLVDDVPPPPDWLPNVHAVKEWQRVAPILIANRLLTTAALSTLGQMCAIHGKVIQLWNAGETPNSALMAQYRAFANDFGLTPVASGKVRPLGEGHAVNEFSGHGRRPTKESD